MGAQCKQCGAELTLENTTHAHTAYWDYTPKYCDDCYPNIGGKNHVCVHGQCQGVKK